MWDAWHKKRTINGTVPGRGLPLPRMYYLDTKKAPSEEQFREWWNYSKWDESQHRYVNPYFDNEYFGDMLRGWWQYGTPAQKERIAAFRRALARTGGKYLSHREWDELRRQIFYSYNTHP